MAANSSQDNLHTVSHWAANSKQLTNERLKWRFKPQNLIDEKQCNNKTHANFVMKIYLCINI